MTNEPSTPKTTTKIRIERTYPASASEVWDLWTKSKGIESWWAPDGFKVEVRKLELQPGGELIYTMTATGPEQVEFMKNAGMPLTTESRKTFTEVTPPKRIAYKSLADFIPDVAPYEFLTVVDITPSGDGVRVVMTVDPMHDEVWTQRLTMGRENELDNLARVIEGTR
jgi:uncharacterized protein YndB with AHSA1/START domain